MAGSATYTQVYLGIKKFSQWRRFSLLVKSSLPKLHNAPLKKCTKRRLNGSPSVRLHDPVFWLCIFKCHKNEKKQEHLAPVFTRYYYIYIFFYKRLHTLQNSNRKLLLEGLDACRHRKDCFQKHLCRCSEWITTWVGKNLGRKKINHQGPFCWGILIGKNFICSVKEHVSWVTRMWGLSANLWQGGMWCTNRNQRV